MTFSILRLLESVSQLTVHACMLSHFSLVRLYVTLWTEGHGTSVHRILQARILERVAMPSSRGSSWPKDRIIISPVSCTGKQVFINSTIWEALHMYVYIHIYLYMMWLLASYLNLAKSFAILTKNIYLL